MKQIENYPYLPYGSELTQQMENAKATGQPWDFIAFGPKKDPDLGPLVRFYGGAAATAITASAPSMTFDVFGNCEVLMGTWMNEENCPNAYDKMFVGKVRRFVQQLLPVLFLVYLGRLHAADVMDCLGRKTTWETMLSAITGLPEEDYLRLQYAEDSFVLHRLMFDIGLYQPWCEGLDAEAFNSALCSAVKGAVQEPFEVDWYMDEWMLVRYHGTANYVAIPENVLLIGPDAFAANRQLQIVRIPKNCCGIDECAFADCVNLQKVWLPDRCDLIGASAFAGCTSLRQVPLPPRGIIEDWAFHGCISLGEVDIPEGISEIGEDVFLDCPNVIIRCKENSVAHQYAQSNGITYELT